jgi:hypothetical protein
MSKYERLFWENCNRYHDLAQKYESNIEVTHPNGITSDGRGTRLSHIDGWNETAVTYYEYRGERV